MKIIFNIFVIILWTSYSFGMGYIWYNHVNNSFGGVRSRSTGFYMNSGEQMAIGTTTPNADIQIYKTSTSSISIDGTVLGCLRLLDTDGAGFTNITTLNGVTGTSTDAICGF